jgi:hypothetical protein
MVQPISIFHLRVASLSRAKGANAVETAARYAAVALREQRTGTVLASDTGHPTVGRMKQESWGQERDVLGFYD